MNITRKAKVAMVGAAAVVLSLAGLGVAWASIPDGGGVIHACYKVPTPSDGTPLSVIDSEAGGACKSGYASLTWNQTGPQGPAGATGPAGPQGPAGISGYQVVTNTIVNSGTFCQQVACGAHVDVTCPPGDQVLGGGANYTYPSGDPVEYMAASLPTDNGTTWHVDFYGNPQLGSEAGDKTLTGYAICARVAS